MSLNHPDEHATGQTLSGRPFLYCPVGDVFSFHPEDASQRYCFWCKKFPEYGKDGIPA